MKIKKWPPLYEAPIKRDLMLLGLATFGLVLCLLKLYLG